jgi:S1-C subfamily serine protease
VKWLILVLSLSMVACSHAPVEVEAKTAYNESQLIRHAAKSVVQILHGTGAGSAFFITPDTLITNCHVVDRVSPDGNELETAVVINANKPNERIYPGKVESCNPYHDIAAVKVVGYKSPYVVDIYSEEDLPMIQLDKVWAVGYPLGVSLYITRGEYQFTHQLSYNSYMCHFTSVPTYPGNSGGALFWINPLTQKIKLVGMPSAGNARAEHMGCSVTSRDIREYLRLGKPEVSFRSAVKHTPPYVNHDMGKGEDEKTLD